MEQAINNVIKQLAQQAVAPMKPGEAMQLTQAALNLAHVLALLDGIKCKEEMGRLDHA